MTVEINAPKLGPLVERMQKYPDKLEAGFKEAMQSTLLTMQGEIPPYPPEPDTSDYRRTGTLGRTLGSGMTGRKAGAPDIFDVKPIGGGIEGHFGSNLEYAPFAVGETLPRWMQHWKDNRLVAVAEKAKGKIEFIWNALARAIAKFIEGQND